MKTSHLQNEFKMYALFEKGMRPKSYKSIMASVHMLCHYTKTEELNDLTKDVIKSYLYYGVGERGWSPKTFRNHLQYLKSFFDFCLQQKYVSDNPTIAINKPKLKKSLPRCISTEDAKKVLYHTTWYKWRYQIEKYRNFAMIAMLMMTGIRLQEMLDLEVADVSLNTSTIFIREGKGQKDRKIPIHPKLLTILREYFAMKEKLGKPSLHFFTGVRSDKKLYQKNVREICKKISVSSGVKFTPHMLRHTFAREMIDQDFNLYKLKEIMGHAQITTTQRYLSISTNAIKQSFGQVNIF